MPVQKEFSYPSRGKGRPQILLLGNGLERAGNQKSWEDLVKSIKVDSAPILSEDIENSLPFPLLYEILSTPSDASAHFEKKDIIAEEKRLKQAVDILIHTSNMYLDRIPKLGADHILTTNYTYCLEAAFYPRKDFLKSSNRSAVRFYCNGEKEKYYRLHSGYLAGDTGLWHIHGEVGNTQGIVLGHDRYGRLLGKIAEACKGQKYNGAPNEIVIKEFDNWPELFLYGDIYVLGFSFDTCEFDLWWLLRRKQREFYSDGCVYFYERPTNVGFTSAKHLLLRANGVTVLDAGAKPDCEFGEFYDLALNDIAQRIADNRD